MPWPNATTRFWNGVDGVLRRKTTTGIALCCARAASGHATAPPNSVMIPRRFIRSPHRRAQAMFRGTSRPDAFASWSGADGVSLFLCRDHPVGRLDVGGHAILAGPVRVFRHLDVFLDVVE